MNSLSVFNRAEWEQRIPLHDLKSLRPWNCLTSPAHLLQRERIVDVAGRKSPEVPADVFVFGKGEPTLPYSTKIGGLPYRSRRQPWPCSRQGHPLTFLAQLYLSESPVAGMPGDVLLLFGGDRGPNEWQIEWSSVDGCDPMSQDGVPETGWDFEPCYGVRFPTTEFAWSDSPQWGIIAGTKIGGLPWVMPDDPLPEGQFVASVGSLMPAIDTPFPWCNVASAITVDESLQQRAFCYGDVNVLNIIRMPSGECGIHTSSTLPHFSKRR